MNSPWGYPLPLHFASYQDHVRHVKENCAFYNNILKHISEELGDENKILKARTEQSEHNLRISREQFSVNLQAALDEQSRSIQKSAEEKARLKFESEYKRANESFSAQIDSLRLQQIQKEQEAEYAAQQNADKLRSQRQENSRLEHALKTNRDNFETSVQAAVDERSLSLAAEAENVARQKLKFEYEGANNLLLAEIESLRRMKTENERTADIAARRNADELLVHRQENNRLQRSLQLNRDNFNTALQAALDEKSATISAKAEEAAHIKLKLEYKGANELLLGEVESLKLQQIANQQSAKLAAKKKEDELREQREKNNRLEQEFESSVQAALDEKVQALSAEAEKSARAKLESEYTGEKKKLSEKVDTLIAENSKFRESLEEHKNKKRKREEETTPPWVGKNFEDAITIVLKHSSQMKSLAADISQQAGNRGKCDVWIKIPNLGLIKLEAKNKKEIKPHEIAQFSAATSARDCIGSILWSRYCKIPNVSLEKGDFLIHNNTLYLIGENYEEAQLYIYLFILHLKRIKHNDNQSTSDVLELIKMWKRSYISFKELKKVIKKMDTTLQEEFDYIQDLSNRHMQINPDLKDIGNLKKNDVYLVPQSSIVKNQKGKPYK